MQARPAGAQIDAITGQLVAPPGRAWLAYRGLSIAIVTLVYLATATAAASIVAVMHGRTAGRRHFYRRLVQLVQRLGPTFVKFGQIMSGRRDALPHAVCDELAVLHDAVVPMSEADTRRALSAAYGNGAEAPFVYEQLVQVASGSIATVFRGCWIDGREVAVKLQRPGIARLMMADLGLLEAFVRLAERLPKCRGVPIGDLTAYVSTAILGQLDFAREAASLSRIRADLSGIPGVTVPAVLAEASRANCLVMEFIPGLDARNVAFHGRHARRRLAATALLAVRQMIFVDGFVHCDLHPGNLYVTHRGDVVILDGGFSVQLPDRVRRLIAEFFSELSTGNGRRCAEIIIESAVHIWPGTNLDEFIERVIALVDAQTDPSAPPFAMMTFGNELFDLQREFHLHAESDFVFPLMSLAVSESTLRTLSPDLDFRQLGCPGAVKPSRTTTAARLDVALPAEQCAALPSVAG
jgi:ubiquinone biosynthesis protein